MSTKFNIAIAGATGNVGREIIQILEVLKLSSLNFKLDRLIPTPSLIDFLTSILPSMSELVTRNSKLFVEGSKLKVVSRNSKGPNLIFDINASLTLIFGKLFLPKLFVNK